MSVALAPICPTCSRLGCLKHREITLFLPCYTACLSRPSREATSVQRRLCISPKIGVANVRCLTIRSFPRSNRSFRFPAAGDGGERRGRAGGTGAVPRPGRLHCPGQHQHLAEPLLLASGVSLAAREDAQAREVGQGGRVDVNPLRWFVLGGGGIGCCVIGPRAAVLLVFCDPLLCVFCTNVRDRAL